MQHVQVKPRIQLTAPLKWIEYDFGSIIIRSPYTPYSIYLRGTIRSEVSGRSLRSSVRCETEGRCAVYQLKTILAMLRFACQFALDGTRHNLPPNFKARQPPPQYSILPIYDNTLPRGVFGIRGAGEFNSRGRGLVVVQWTGPSQLRYGSIMAFAGVYEVVQEHIGKSTGSVSIRVYHEYRRLA